jgi:hypothetical protein
MRKLLVALGAAVAMLTTIMVGPAQAASSCITYNYSDGVAMFRACDSNYVNLSDNSWISYQRSLWNPDAAHGGHSSDAIINIYMFNVSSDSIPPLDDGETDYSNTAHTLNDANTMWFCLQVWRYYDGLGTYRYNRQVSFNNTGAASVTVSSTCGPATIAP